MIPVRLMDSWPCGMISRSSSTWLGPTWFDWLHRLETREKCGVSCMIPICLMDSWPCGLNISIRAEAGHCRASRYCSGCFRESGRHGKLDMLATCLWHPTRSTIHCIPSICSKGLCRINLQHQNPCCTIAHRLSLFFICQCRGHTWQTPNGSCIDPE